MAATVGLALVAAAQAQVPTPAPTQSQTPLPTTIPGQMPMTTPTPEQLQMLQQLPESQRQQLMQSLGITDFDLQRQTAEQMRLQQAAPTQAAPSEGEQPQGPPKLEAGSTVIVKLRLPRAQATDGAAARRTRAPAAPPPAPGIDEEQRELQALAQLESNGTVDPDVERLWQQRLQRNAQLGLLLGPATYLLDREGRIQFPGVATISLAGLTEVQAARRIEAEPSLRPLVADVTLLPLEKFGVDALEPFGYDLF
jgi:protein involved in polysaccharide export with SLBB domain